MSHSLIWLPDVLEQAGLKVALVDGWENRGSRDVGEIFGIICHHTAGGKTGNMPSLNTLIHGRSDLPGPLSQLGLGRDGTYYVISAGRCNHAGGGIWRGLVNGNTNFIGIEAENTGKANDFPWPEIQIEAYQRGVAAILKRIGRGAEFCAAHREYALPKGRKPDANFDMVEFRTKVAAFMNSSDEPRVIPLSEPSPAGSIAGRPTLRRGNKGVLVKQLQEKLQLDADGSFGAKTEAALRQFQRSKNVVPDGIVGPKTWKLLDEV